MFVVVYVSELFGVSQIDGENDINWIILSEN